MDERRFYVKCRTKPLGEPQRRWRDSFCGGDPHRAELRTGRDSLDLLLGDVDRGYALLLPEDDARRWAMEQAMAALNASAFDATLCRLKDGWQVVNPGVAVYRWLIRERPQPKPAEPAALAADLTALVDRIMTLPLHEAAALFENEAVTPLKTAHLAVEDRIAHAARIAVYLSMRIRHQANHATAVDASNRLTSLIGQALGRYETKPVSF